MAGDGIVDTDTMQSRFEIRFLRRADWCRIKTTPPAEHLIDYLIVIIAGEKMGNTLILHF